LRKARNDLQLKQTALKNATGGGGAAGGAATDAKVYDAVPDMVAESEMDPGRK